MKKFLMGMTCYGNHIEYFINYCLPSLLTDGNLLSLTKERFVTIKIHTDSEGYAKLFQLPFPEGVEYSLSLDASSREEKYFQLGQHQTNDLREAKRLGADYHCLMPDFIYSCDYFAGVLKASEKHKVIARLVLSTILEDIILDLERYKFNNILQIPANHLATLALQHIHPGIKHWVYSKEGWPNSHVLVMEGQNHLHLLSPHCTPVYIANEAIRLPANGTPLDNRLDKITIGKVYCPKPEDGIVQIEISPRASRKEGNYVDLNEFLRIFKVDTENSREQWEIWNEETIDPIKREMLKTFPMNDIEILKTKNFINDELNKAFPLKQTGYHA